MKHFMLQDQYDISYPVGRNMGRTLDIVTNMVEHFKSIYEPDKPIVLLVRGSSGAILAGIFVTMLPNYSITIQHIKKAGEKSHSGGFHVDRRGKTFVIIDDFMSTGETVNEIYNKTVEYVGEVQIDTLILSGMVTLSRLNFLPNYVISGEYRKTY